MVWLVMLVFLVALAALIWFAPRSRAGSGLVVTPAELDAVKNAAHEDAAALGDAMLELDVVLSGQRLTKALRKDYQVAFDSLQTALQTVPTVTKPDQLRRVAEHLVGGGYAITCVRARVDHQRIPKQRTPCFFNPQHGPSVTTVPWAPEGGTSRDVPACASDAERVTAGAEAELRQVLVDDQRIPYWQSGAAFAPWIAGYFEAFGSMDRLFEGTPAGGLLSGPPSGGSRRRSR